MAASSTAIPTASPSEDMLAVGGSWILEGVAVVGTATLGLLGDVLAENLLVDRSAVVVWAVAEDNSKDQDSVLAEYVALVSRAGGTDVVVLLNDTPGVESAILTAVAKIVATGEETVLSDLVSTFVFSSPSNTFLTPSSSFLPLYEAA